ncbi:hypothetical protein EZ428_21290 [Pedobacter frigiditerrae]|uniref:AbiTii domain-containing protein n=1 Tax=Pedobacter frigiditerrae TaxID=2530452 RepID=A0A4R0ML53_9SPHI|nr:hypothetical protein [Pedobacter frigiditerrae]TCC87243.1 hypothetical protein EZ428_21290 [Pedobacter frigiditerrae]
MNDNYTFLLQQVIEDLLNGNNSLEIPLLKLNYFSRLVKNEKLLRFTELEINGYKGETPPKYRQTIAKLTVVLQKGYESTTFELPISNLEAPFDTQLQYVKMTEGIRIIEAMAAKEIVDNSSSLGTPVPPGMLAYVKKAVDKISNQGLTPTAAMISGNPTLTMQIVSTVRYRLLAFATDIAEKFGYSIEISTFKDKQELNNQIINNYIKNKIVNNGNQNVSNTGDKSKINLQKKQ